MGRRGGCHPRRRGRIFLGVELIETFKSLFLGTDYSIFQPSSGETVLSLKAGLEKADQRLQAVRLSHKWAWLGPGAGVRPLPLTSDLIRVRALRGWKPKR